MQNPSAPEITPGRHDQAEILVNTFNVVTVHDVPFHFLDKLYGVSQLYRPRFRAIFGMKGVTTMTELRSLFEALLVLGFIIAAGIVLGVMFR
jgi:hypothetical protein